MAWLKPQRVTASQFWRLDVPDGGTRRSDSLWGLWRRIWPVLLPDLLVVGWKSWGLLWLVDASPPSVHTSSHGSPPVCVCALRSPLYKLTSHIRLGPHPTQQDLNLANYICNNHILEGHILRSWKSEFQHTIFEGHNLTHINLLHLCLARAVFHT